MDDKLRESISALMDDEANELEAQRVLSKAGSVELSDTWKRYHKVRDLMSGMSKLPVSSINKGALQIDVSANVAAAIRDQALPDEQDNARSSKASNGSIGVGLSEKTLPEVGSLVVDTDSDSVLSWIKFGGAIAACLVVAVGVSLNTNNSIGVHSSAELAQVSDEQPVVNELDEGQVHSFNKYLLRHSELSALKVSLGMAPLIRVASVNSVGIYLGLNTILLRFALSFLVLVSSLVLMAGHSHADSDQAKEWLSKMRTAALQESYRGTFMFSRGEMSSSMRVVHRFHDGQEQERLTQLDGV